MNTPGTVPLDVWKECCALAAEAVMVRVLYERQAMYFVESARKFIVAPVGAGVKELAERYLARNIEDMFQTEFLSQTLVQAQAQRERDQGAKLND